MTWPGWSALLNQLTVVQDSPALLVVAGVAAGIFATVGPVWGITTIAVTAVHELGHAIAATIVGAKVQGLRLRADGTGHTAMSFPTRVGRLRRAFVAWWGHPVPTLVGAGALVAVVAGYGSAVVAVATGGALAVTAWARNLLGLVVGAALTAGGTLAVLAGADACAGIGAFLGSVAAVGGLHHLAEHGRAGGSPDSDANTVSRALFVPVRVVTASFWAISVAAAVGTVAYTVTRLA